MARLPSGADLQLFDTLDSTSLEARRRADADEKGPRWIVALTQTAGYGRRGRAWQQRTGDFAGTLFFAPDASIEARGQLSFVTALALAAALDEFIDSNRIRLKWPNDLLLDGCKCAGILLENLGHVLSIGIGVNLVTAPKDTPYPTACLLDAAGTAPEPQELAARIDHHFWAIYQDWSKLGFEPVRALWLARAAGIGKSITVRLPNEELHGVFEGIDESGALVLRSAAGKRTIAAGEVFFASPSEN